MCSVALGPPQTQAASHILRLLQVLLKEFLLLLVLEVNFEQSTESTFVTKFESLESCIGMIPGIMPAFGK